MIDQNTLHSLMGAQQKIENNLTSARISLLDAVNYVEDAKATVAISKLGLDQAMNIQLLVVPEGKSNKEQRQAAAELATAPQADILRAAELELARMQLHLRRAEANYDVARIKNAGLNQRLEIEGLYEGAE